MTTGSARCVQGAFWMWRMANAGSSLLYVSVGSSGVPAICGSLGTYCFSGWPLTAVLSPLGVLGSKIPLRITPQQGPLLIQKYCAFCPTPPTPLSWLCHCHYELLKCSKANTSPLAFNFKKTHVKLSITLFAHWTSIYWMSAMCCRLYSRHFREWKRNPHPVVLKF